MIRSHINPAQYRPSLGLQPFNFDRNERNGGQENFPNIWNINRERKRMTQRADRIRQRRPRPHPHRAQTEKVTQIHDLR